MTLWLRKWLAQGVWCSEREGLNSDPKNPHEAGYNSEYLQPQYSYEMRGGQENLHKLSEHLACHLMILRVSGCSKEGGFFIPPDLYLLTRDNIWTIFFLTRAAFYVDHDMF